MDTSLTRLIFLAGLGQLSILIASATVVFRLNWRIDLRQLPRLHRQMFWTYAGYVLLSIVAFAVISIINADELASGGALARGFCAYVAVFWAIRGGLQAVFDAKQYLTAWWLKAGYFALSVMFVALAIIYGWAALLPHVGPGV
jgi:hypothetical protein